MNREEQMKLAYWFFLIAGFIGIGLQMYKYYNDTLELTFEEGAVTMLCVVFIFRPKILIEAAQTVINFKFKK